MAQLIRNSNKKKQRVGYVIVMVSENKGALRHECHKEDYGLREGKRTAGVRVNIDFFLNLRNL